MESKVGLSWLDWSTNDVADRVCRAWFRLLIATSGFASRDLVNTTTELDVQLAIS